MEHVEVEWRSSGDQADRLGARYSTRKRNTLFLLDAHLQQEAPNLSTAWLRSVNLKKAAQILAAIFDRPFRLPIQLHT